MSRPYEDDRYVEDSEGEEMVLGPRPPIARNSTGGPPRTLPSPLVWETQDETVSSIQTTFSTATFTDNRNHQTKVVQDAATSSIRTSYPTMDRSVVSEISSFGPNTHNTVASSIQTSGTTIYPKGSSISTSTIVSAPKAKPQPRPAYKRKDPAAGDSSISTGATSSVAPSSTDVSLPSLHLIPPPAPPAPPSAPPSIASSSRIVLPTAITIPSTLRLDSGIEMMDVDMMDIAERAKTRSRKRSQVKAKQVIPIDDDVIELPSSDDELSFLPTSKPKPKPRTKKPGVSKPPESEKAKDKGKGRGKTKDPSKPSPRKRSKTSRVPDSGFESDVNTIPVPTSDFPVPNLPTHFHPNSQLPPSDPPPPPSTAGSSSAPSVPQTSQEPGAPGLRDESPLSSPPPPMPRNRKRLRPVSDLDSDSDFGANEDSILVGASGAAPLKVHNKGKTKESSALPAPLPPGPSPQVVPGTPSPVKSKAPRRKRKDADADEGWGGDLPEKSSVSSKGRKKPRIEEEDDEDWADGAPKSKAKSKTTKKPAPKEKIGKSKADPKGKTPKSKEIAEDADEQQAAENGNKSAAADKDRDVMPPPPVPTRTSGRMEKVTPSTTTEDVTNATEGPKSSVSRKGKGKQRVVVFSDDEDDADIVDDVSKTSGTAVESSASVAQKKGGRKSIVGDLGAKENDAPPAVSTASAPSSTPATPKPTTPSAPMRSSFAQANRAYTIGYKQTKSTPMSELIRRVSSLPGSPFPTTSRPTHSPLAKGSKSALRRIAPLHPNRRTPPPPLPKAPPPKKSKKMLELEEKWEMELEDTVEGWYTMSEEERATLRRQKKDFEMGYED